MMIDPQSLSRPKVFRIVLLTVFVGTLLLVSGITLLSSLHPANGIILPDEFRTIAYVNLLAGVLLFVAAFLIARYKRLGLLLGLPLQIVVLGWNIYNIINGLRPNIFGILTMIVMAAAIYNLYTYLTHEPEKQFFT